MLKATQLLLPVNLAEHYIGFYVANRVGGDLTSDPIRQLGDRCCPSGDSCRCSCWFSQGGVVQSVCGNGGCCSMGAYTGGLGYPRVTHVRSVRHRLRQPIIDSVSRSTSLIPGVP